MYEYIQFSICKKWTKYGHINCITQIRNVDNYTYYHCINVSILAMLIGKWLQRTYCDPYACTGWIVHDVGKSLIPGSIIKKPAKLTENEYEKVKKHSQYDIAN